MPRLCEGSVLLGEVTVGLTLCGSLRDAGGRVVWGAVQPVPVRRQRATVVGHVLRRGICSRGGGWKRAQRVLLVHRPFKTREADDGQVPVSSDKARVQTIYRTEVKEQKSSSEVYIKKIINLETHDSLMGTKMKSFWKRSTCRVHVFTLLCFLFWILEIQNQRLKLLVSNSSEDNVM